MERLTGTISSFLMLLLLLACSASTDLAGTATQAGNGYLSGVVISSTDSTAVKGASVWVRSAHFLADTSGDSSELYEATSDETGHFYFDSLPDGEYAIEIRENDSSMAMHRFTIAGSNHHAGNISVQASGSYFGTVDTSLVPVGMHFYARVYGLNIQALINRFGEYYYPNLPAGMQILHIISADPQVGLVSIDTVFITSGTADTAASYQFIENWSRDSIIIEDILTENALNLKVEDVIVRNENGRVEELLLDNVGLKHMVPAITHVTKLRKIVITNNPDLETLASGLEKLGYLEHLDISRNSIITLPGQIVSLETLQYLSLDYNKLPPGPDFITKWIDTWSVNPNWRDTQTK